MLQGIAENKRAIGKFGETYAIMLNSGYFFRRARQACKDGAFTELLELYQDQIGRTTVYRYIEQVEIALEWAAQEKPALRGNEGKLLEHAKTQVILSPKPMIATLRALGLMRKFGEYDEIAYRKKKLLNGPQQIELPFEQVSATLDALLHINEDNFILRVPEGMPLDKAFEELETKFATGLEAIRAARKDLTAPLLAP